LHPCQRSMCRKQHDAPYNSSTHTRVTTTTPYKTSEMSSLTPFLNTAMLQGNTPGSEKKTGVDTWFVQWL